MKTTPTGIALLLLFFIFSCNNQEEEKISLVSIEEKQVLLDLDEVQLIDVRTAEEYSQGHLINSHNIDYNSSSFEKDIAKLDRQKPIVVYCQKGGRSAKCAKKFLKAGFVDIYDLEGGYSQWLHEEIELE